jgi:hypothetical protein
VDGATLYKVTDDHYVCVCCIADKHRHKGRVLLERALPQEWECFASGVNIEDGVGLFHYGPAS